MNEKSAETCKPLAHRRMMRTALALATFLARVFLSNLRPEALACCRCRPMRSKRERGRDGDDDDEAASWWWSSSSSSSMTMGMSPCRGALNEVARGDVPVALVGLVDEPRACLLEEGDPPRPRPPPPLPLVAGAFAAVPLAKTSSAFLWLVRFWLLSMSGL